MIQIPHRVGGALRRKIVRIGAAPSGLLAGMHLHQLAAGEHPHQRPVGAHLDALTDQVARHRVQRLGDFDVMVAVNLGCRVDRHVVGRRGRRPEPGLLLDAENLRRAGLDGAVHPHPSPLSAPRLDPALGVGEIDEVLAGEEALTHERHHPLHPRLGPRRQRHPMPRVMSELSG
jgi:hypothetical protein